MTQQADEEGFQRGLEELLARFDRSLRSDAAGPYAGEGPGQPHEHTTRVHFLDELVQLLGWQLGLGGDMAEEARLRNGTVTRMDYLGVTSQTNTPVLLIEAKAFDKPFITPRANGGNTAYEYATLIAQAIEHWRGGGDRNASPAMPEWHDHLAQVGGYVCGLDQAHGHELPRAVLTSGKWLVVFLRPLATFRTDTPSASDIAIFQMTDFARRALELYRLLSKVALCLEVPHRIRATQILSYAASEALVDCFHALHVRYEASGSHFFTPRPRILVYPALVLRRNDDALLTVIESEDPLFLAYSRQAEDPVSALRPHLEEVDAAAAALLQRVYEEVGRALPVSTLDAFPGFPVAESKGSVERKSLVKRHPTASDHWVVATGTATHFLKPVPEIECRFHQWKECRQEGAGDEQGAVSVPRTEPPRSFFVDHHPHHCAHRGLRDRRQMRCQIPSIDEMICCKACVFESVCWPGTQQPPMPCGRA